MTNEEKLREALMQVMDSIERANKPVPVSVKVYENAIAILKETAPPKSEHPAIKAFYDWNEEGDPATVTGIDKAVLERRRETFLAGYRAGMMQAADIGKQTHGMYLAEEYTKAANEVPTV